MCLVPRGRWGQPGCPGLEGGGVSHTSRAPGSPTARMVPCTFGDDAPAGETPEHWG